MISVLLASLFSYSSCCVWASSENKLYIENDAQSFSSWCGFFCITKRANLSTDKFSVVVAVSMMSIFFYSSNLLCSQFSSDSVLDNSFNTTVWYFQLWTQKTEKKVIKEDFCSAIKYIYLINTNRKDFWKTITKFQKECGNIHGNLSVRTFN